jgi:hypothetical protein
MIKAIFFARFHPERGVLLTLFFHTSNSNTNSGSCILSQVPDNAIVADADHNSAEDEGAPLFDFGAISGVVIPAQEFCNRLMTVCANKFRIIGFPVCIHDPKYKRNQFIFNLALVLDEEDDFSSYVSVVRKLAALFRNLEEQNQFLSKEESVESWAAFPGDYISRRGFFFENTATSYVDNWTSNGHTDVAGRSAAKVYSLCEMIFEDLNNYYECMIPIGKLGGCCVEWHH